MNHTSVIKLQPDDIALGAPPGAAPQVAAPVRSCLFHPVIDFLLLGGASFLILPAVLLLSPSDPARLSVAATMLVLANFINHPHFAHSYQLFYRNFFSKLFDRGTYSPALRYRYALAGLVVPAALVAFFAYSVHADRPELVALGVNAMGFLVGWHYVKQGYGMLMVGCVLEKRFFSLGEKTLLRANGYACWLFSWVAANREFREHDYWGLSYFTVGTPDWMYWATATTAGVSTLLVLGVIARRVGQWRSSAPLNGLMAYGVTLYLWIVFVSIDPVFLLVVPALHSLQYLAVVWRYKLNALQGGARSEPGSSSETRREPYLRFALFLAVGYAAGYYGFYLLPEFLDTRIVYEPMFGQTLFMFLFWIFINIHHYFIDNVIWRSDNPDTRLYLFSAA